MADQAKDDTQIFRGKMKSSPKMFMVIAGVVVAALLLGGGLYVKSLKDENSDLKKNSSVEDAKKVDRIVEKVGKLIVLPKGEPSLATVKDKEKLTDQPFFAKAEDGDFVLIYTEAKQAILYRESENKIINVAPLIIDETTTTTAP